MSSTGKHVNIGDADDYTYTEDPAGQQVRVPVSNEYVFKVVILGDYSVGKTSLIKQLLSISASPLSPRSNDDGSDLDESVAHSDVDDVLETVTPTIGTDFYSLTVTDVAPSASVRLQIWDTAGLEKYAANYESTFRNASFVICLFDVTNPSSLNSVVDRHLSLVGEHMPHLDQSAIMVVANKIDLIADVSANSTKEGRSASKRSRIRGNEFVNAIDNDASVDTSDGSTDILTSADGVRDDIIVTAQEVQEEVFDLFTDVHYAEVSAKTKRYLREMLEAVCYALLRENVADNGKMRLPHEAPLSEVFARTVLPRHRSAKGLTGASEPPIPALSASQVDPATTTTTQPIAVPRDSPTAGSLQQTPKNTPAPVSASWRSSEAFSFDLAPAHLSAKAFFSPAEGSDVATDKPGVCDSPLRHVGCGSDSPVDMSSTWLPTPPRGAEKVVDARSVHLDLEADSTGPPATPDSKVHPKTRKEREKAEMTALLRRADGRKGNLTGHDAGTGSPVAWLESDADKMENDVARGLKHAGDVPSTSRPGPCSFLLDSKRVEGHREGTPGAGSRDSDDDGAGMQMQLKQRFAQIEHDIRQKAAAEKQRAKEAKKKQKKAEEKCKCCIL
ncbi:hypothetical protein, conserved [Leishmania tarentolae]|uniref:Ras-like small GTPases n=1 Tax=Leishmania tarentolae TaxID=5689 RepID=A0A640KPA5_LEITA|nr:hypothetical protein, conserved [Leishmania tarentolae]